jgi:hypothetical protein
MPYNAEIRRDQKGCFLFLLDQSYSMTDPIGGSDKPKQQVLMDAINRWLQTTVVRCTTSEGFKDFFDISVIGYRTDTEGTPIVEPVLQGDLVGREIVTVTEVANGIARFESRTQVIPDEETGELLEMPSEFPIWVEGKADNGTPMCHALLKAHELLSAWTAEHPSSFPPIVVHISDGESQDGDPVPYAEAVQALSTDDGNVLVFNCHLSETPADAMTFPVSGEVLPDELAKVLFKMSSPLPESITQTEAAQQAGVRPGSRGMVFNADGADLIRFLNVGTRPRNLR